MEEGLKEGEVLMITYIEDEIHNYKETSSKKPKRRIRTRSMVKEELQFQEKDKIFTTYERRSRKHQQGQNKQATKNDDEVQQRHYVYIQSLEIQEESLIGEIGQNDEEVHIIFEQQTREETLELDIQTVEKTPDDKREQDNEDIAIISPIFEQQATKKKNKSA